MSIGVLYWWCHSDRVVFISLHVFFYSLYSRNSLESQLFYILLRLSANGFFVAEIFQNNDMVIH